MKLCKIAIIDYSTVFAKILKKFLYNILDDCDNKLKIKICTTIDNFKDLVISKEYDLYFISDIFLNYNAIKFLECMDKEIGIKNLPLIIINANEANVEKLKKYLNKKNIPRDKIILLYKPISINSLKKVLSYIRINGEKIENLKKV